MRVKSAYKGLLNQLAVGPSITIVMLVIFFTSSSFTEHTDREAWAKQVNLMIRQLGHRLLLQAGDSTSRVLPVTETREGTFQLRFENEVAINHDSLIALSQGLLPKTVFPSGYTLTVHESMKTDILYGFQVNNVSSDILGCKGRSEPLGHYRIEIVFPDLYKRVVRAKRLEQEKKNQSTPTDNQLADLKPKDLRTTIVKTEPLVASQSIQSYPIVKLVFGGMLLVLGIAILLGRFGKALKPEAKKLTPELLTLGKFKFDVKDRRLLLGNEVINLTDKESKILDLLNKDFGELISREVLMQKIWIDEGVITGRSLDMFISKLRKKLSGDPELRITNVHGKGYKLEILERIITPPSNSSPGSQSPPVSPGSSQSPT